MRPTQRQTSSEVRTRTTRTDASRAARKRDVQADVLNRLGLIGATKDGCLSKLTEMVSDALGYQNIFQASYERGKVVDSLPSRTSDAVVIPLPPAVQLRFDFELIVQGGSCYAHGTLEGHDKHVYADMGSLKEVSEYLYAWVEKAIREAAPRVHHTFDR